MARRWTVGVIFVTVGCGGSTTGTGSQGVTGSGGGSGGIEGGGSGGQGGTGGLPAGVCVSPRVLVYEAPGCDGAVKPVCIGPTFNACALTVCACDGTTIEGCHYEKPYRYIGVCRDGSAPRDASSDACVPEKVTLSLRQAGGECFLDLPPDTDRSVPISLAGEFGRLPKTFYVSGINASDCAQGYDGWLPVSGNTVRICGQACTIFGLVPYTVTLMCGGKAPSDAGARD